jgi:hypothetical protein
MIMGDLDVVYDSIRGNIPIKLSGNPDMTPFAAVQATTH